MELTKSQVQSVKNRLDKLQPGHQITNDEIRKVAETTEEFDSLAIANRLLEKLSSSLTPGGLSPENNLNFKLSGSGRGETTPPESLGLTVSQKIELVKTQAVEQGIEISSEEILQVVSELGEVRYGILNDFQEMQSFQKAVISCLQRIRQRYESDVAEILTDLNSEINLTYTSISKTNEEFNQGIQKVSEGVKAYALTKRTSSKQLKDSLQKATDQLNNF